MKVKILEEHGYESALRGMAYSFKDRALDPDIWWQEQRERAVKRAPKLAPMEGGHNKFIRQIEIWVDIEAARAWWSEFDTYKVGTVTQSESTMHTLSKRQPISEDFEEGTPEAIVNAFIECWQIYKSDVTALKHCLPEGFLQRRIVKMNYANVKNIISQREGHRYKFWKPFIEQLKSQLEHPQFVE